MITDKRMLRLIDLLRFENKIKSELDFCNAIEMLPQKITKVRNGSQHFTVKQIESACEKFNVNANWIFGLNDSVYNEKNSIKIKDI